MPGKTWNTQFGPLKIKFENVWSFSGHTRETLTVNGTVVSEVTKDFNNKLKDLATGNHQAVVDAEGKEYEVSAILGSKWPGLFTGCHLFVNGKLVGGDTKSKLMLVDRDKKKASNMAK